MFMNVYVCYARSFTYVAKQKNSVGKLPLKIQTLVIELSKCRFFLFLELDLHLTVFGAIKTDLPHSVRHPPLNCLCFYLECFRMILLSF